MDIEIGVSSMKMKDGDAEVMLGILRAVDTDNSLTQRSAANDLGIALGLVNTYLKRCVKKGFIKVKQVPANRYGYYLTPKGFAEKSRLTAEYLSQSLSLFKQAKNDYRALLQECKVKNWQNIALCGASDLADIFVMYAREHPVNILGIIDTEKTDGVISGFATFERLDSLKTVPDVCVITDLQRPQATYDALIKMFPPERVLVSSLLELKTKSSRKGGR